MNAAEHTRHLLAMNGLPRHIIAKVESLFADYKLPDSAAQVYAFNDLLHNFLDLYYEEGSAAVVMFDSYLIK